MKKLIFMKKVIVLLTVFLLIGCGGGGGGGDNDGDGDTNAGGGGNKSVLVIGDIYNDVLERGSLSVESTDSVQALKPSSSYSTLIDITNLERLSAISAGNWINVTTTVINDGDGILKNLSYEIMLEDAIFLTPEVWTCLQCFPHGSGKYCNGVWQVDGGTLVSPQPEPTLPVCNGIEPSPSGYCYEVFPPDIDCSSPSWHVSYEMPGDGLWKASGTIEILPVGETFNSSVGFSHSAMDVRPDHYARWIVKKSDGTILVQKDYVFDVVP